MHEGRLQLSSVPVPVDADLLDVLGLRAEEAPKRIVITLAHRQEAVLTGASRRTLSEVAAAYRTEVAERRLLAALLSEAL
ncbi:hypothetical protein [Arthrobacter sp. YN]|uniref:hypothetical protein n=1 Tax=Arthrobacter sp. YN TaxID=2020486 RepID=UPI000B61DE65|nr:hypothetical protein [Arthrobacter sp. YN]ASN19883.1 hypothetical protein CGK93_09510 [Arthrobacter sp. YN]